MAAEVTVYRLRANHLAQISGTNGAPNVAPTYAATMSIDPNAGLVQTIAGLNSTSATCTLNAASAGQAQQLLIFLLQDTGGVTYTFGTNFKSTGTANPTTTKTIQIMFVSDGTNWREICRSTAV